MARTYKVYGCAHDPSGSLDVTLSVGGNEVFNSSITAETTPHTEIPLDTGHLFSFDVDESLTGNQNWSITVTGSDDSADLHIAQDMLECNKVRPNMTIELEYFTDKINAMDDPATDAFEASVQTHIANTIGETALGSTVYNKMIAGTSVPADDARVVMEANELEGLDADVYYAVEGARTSLQVDGEAVSLDNNATIYAGSGSTATLTWDMTPPTFEYDPPLPA